MAVVSRRVVYHSLAKVLETLEHQEVVKTVPKISELNKLLSNVNNVNVSPVPLAKNRPFIVIEGLDGSGKSSVSNGVASKLGLMVTPPKSISIFKDLFDELNESVRRAYYSSGNYIAAQEVTEICSPSSSHKGVIMDRYWSSTAAYAFAHEIMKNGKDSVSPSDFIWPSDLLQPDLVIFLVVSEETRRFRHQNRNTTNTKEEQTLANSPVFRLTLIDCYKRIQGPKTIQVDANNTNASPTATTEENINAVINLVCDEITKNLQL